MLFFLILQTWRRLVVIYGCVLCICWVNDSNVMGVYFFFFKQKTAYELRISDWSSDVCSSDLIRAVGGAMYLAGFLILVVNVWATLAGRVRVEKPMTETRHNAAADRPLAPVPAQ